MVETARQKALKSVNAGDVIFGVGAGGQPKLMFVIEGDDRQFSTRHITTGIEIEFGRDGTARQVPDGGSCTIISIAALPAKWHKVAVGLDHKMRNGEKPEDFKLSEDEIQLLLMKDDYYRARPLPES